MLFALGLHSIHVAVIQAVMSHSETVDISGHEVVKVARHVTWVGFWINAALGLLKVLAGIFGRSSAMVADGVHSFTDFFTDIIVLIFVGISRRKANYEFQYGHGKFETFATMLLALILGIVGLMFFVDGAEKTWHALHGTQLPEPTWLALAMAVVSIASKEWLFRYTRAAGERIHSPVVVANAWHHRSDAVSSLATLLGIAGAMFLGARWRVLDPVAAMVVSVFIVLVSVKIGRPAVAELLEVSLPADIVEGMYRVIGHTPGVEAFHHFASRRNGNRMIVDCHIKVNPRITVDHAHRIATDVESRLKEAYGQDLLVTLHIEPYMGQEVDDNNMCR